MKNVFVLRSPIVHLAWPLLLLRAPVLLAAVDFEKEVWPILVEHCHSCHGSEKQNGGLRLDNKADAFKPGDSGDLAIVPRSSDTSLLVALVRSHDESDRMPKRADALSPAQVELLRRWVDEGAVWKQDSAPAKSGKTEMVVTEKDKQYWAFRPLQTIAPPKVQDETWSKTPIDLFILAALESKGLAPSPRIGRSQEVRRLTYNLTGLPPTPEETAAYEKDTSGNAYEELVSRLLGSPHYGEKRGRMWLDVARYADSDGFEADYDRPTAWRYRDFVIRAWNDDMPFDQFVRWQLAGDELAPDSPEALAATGFLAAGPQAETQATDLPENKEKVRYDNLDDIVSTVGSAFLGVTIGCARCHDHKYDPVPTRDYYSLLGAFATARRGDQPQSRAHRELGLWLEHRQAEWREQHMEMLQIPEKDRVLLRAVLNKNNQTQKAVFKKWSGPLVATEVDLRAFLTDAQKAELTVLEGRTRAAGIKDVPTVYAMLDYSATPEPNWLLHRGDPMQKAEPLTLGFLQALTRDRSAEDYWKQARATSPSTSTGQRAALAQWITDPKQGAGALLARVIVNRVWQQHFGEGLVRTAGDFGLQGDKPSHPELLDWLAGELIRSGWRLKTIERMILNSEVYREDTSWDGARAKVDPENRLLWRRRPLRLTGEELRDAVLMTSGRLHAEAFGPGFKPPVPAEAMSTRSADKYPDKAEDGPALWKRAVYMYVKRSVRFPMMEVFDAPEPLSACSRRAVTTAPTQQLTLLNDPFIRLRAADFANRIAIAKPGDISGQVRLAFQLALGRSPQAAEMAKAVRFIQTRQSMGAPEILARTDFCHALFTLNEFIYVD